GMTSDGSQVYFATRDRLAPEDTDSSVDIYLWRESTDHVTVISQGNGHGDTDECNSAWTSGCDVEPLTTCTAAWVYICNYNHELGKAKPFVAYRQDIDSSIARENGAILFASPEQLDPANPGLPQQRNLYLYRDGQLHYVTTFDPGSSTERFNISPDGLH